jgi:hypothetical protein
MPSSACVAPSKSLTKSCSTGALLLNFTFWLKERRAYYEIFSIKMIMGNNNQLL